MSDLVPYPQVAVEPYQESAAQGIRYAFSNMAAAFGGAGTAVAIIFAVGDLLVSPAGVPHRLILWLASVSCVLLVGSYQQFRRYSTLDKAARRAHEQRALAQREAQLREWRTEPFQLVSFRFVWWKDPYGNDLQLKAGIRIEFRPIHGGRSRKLVIPMRQVGCFASRDALDTVSFPARGTADDFGEAVYLMLANTPFWLRHRLARDV